MDSVSPAFAELNVGAAVSSESGAQDPELRLTALSGLTIDEFWLAADADSADLAKHELARLLLAVGVKYNYGIAPDVSPTRAQICAFWRSLQLPDLALAHACALGRDAAWQQFMARYKEPLTQAAIGIAGSATVGHELADSLYAAMFGLTERDGERRSPLAYYSGRGSLKGFLRATLAQRHVDYHRRTSRETALPAGDLAAAPIASAPPPEVVSRLGDSLRATLSRLEPEERFLLSAWFLDQRTLLEISRILRVHEATVSRRIGRLTARLHQELLASLELSGMSRAAASEALGTDPRDININLRSVLQTSGVGAFPEQSVPAEPERTGVVPRQRRLHNANPYLWDRAGWIRKASWLKGPGASHPLLPNLFLMVIVNRARAATRQRADSRACAATHQAADHCPTCRSDPNPLDRLPHRMTFAMTIRGCIGGPMIYDCLSRDCRRCQTEDGKCSYS